MHRVGTRIGFGVMVRSLRDERGQFEYLGEGCRSTWERGVGVPGRGVGVLGRWGLGYGLV